MDRFWSKVDIKGPDECWEWKAGKNHFGYGAFQMNLPRRSMGAHRYAFYFVHLHWPEPMAIHTCDNRACCNPAHIIEGTQADNMHDMAQKGRWRKGQKPPGFHAARGERQAKAVLTEAKVYEIRRLYGDGVTQKEIAEELGCSKWVVQDVLRRRTWTWVGEE